MTQRSWLRWALLAGGAIALAAIALLVVRPSAVLPKLRYLYQRYSPATVEWETAPPGPAGLDPVALESWWADLEQRDTAAFLVARDGRLIFERYGGGAFANRQMSLAAAAKGIVASLLIAAALDDDLFQLDSAVSEQVTEWQRDPVREAITYGALGSHTSGLEDVPFLGNRGELQTIPWKHDYEANPEVRYELAIERAEVTQAPGMGYQYSGVGYHLISVGLSRAYSSRGERDLREILERRIMRPLGISNKAWVISYGASYEYKNSRVYSIGSGASLTARAVARIGQLILDEGRWRGSQILSPEHVRQILGTPLTERVAEAADKRRGPSEGDALGTGEPLPAVGWYLNLNGFFPSLPRDAVLAAGAGHRVLLIIPSLDLVMVRMGRSLDGERLGPASWVALEEFLFDPLMRSLSDKPT